jgi:hypothetical protein
MLRGMLNAVRGTRRARRVRHCAAVVFRAGTALSGLLACTLDERAPTIAEPEREAMSDETADGNAPGARGGDGVGGGVPGGLSGTNDESASAENVVGNAEVFDFGGIRAGGEAVSFDWTITNGGTGLSSALTLIQTGDLQFTVQNGCQSRLVAGATCNIRVTFKPDTAREFSGALSLDHDGGSLALSLLGKGQNLMTITRVGGGDVTSSPPGLSCDGDRCSGLFDPVVVTFTARTANGSGSHFASWTGSNCRARQACSLTMTRSGGATARFAELEHNLVFTGSTRFSPREGGLAAYDAECNRIASQAGINDAGGGAFIAALSDSSASLRERLGSARGWVRMDGLPFADTAAELFDGFQMSYYAACDELGVQVPTPLTARAAGQALNILTGTLADGSASADHCNDWTSSANDVSFQIGRAASGPSAWLETDSVACGSTLEYRVVCMGVTRSTPLPPAPALASLPAGFKQIWVTNTEYVPGSTTPDEKCQSERPPGVASAVAFITYTDRAAAAVLDPAATYRRPDGMLVGTGDDVANMDIFTAPWIRADGAVSLPAAVSPPAALSPSAEGMAAAWTGATSGPTLTALASENCDDWQLSDPARVGALGNSLQGSIRFFVTGVTATCDSPRRLYCVEP